MDLTYDLRARTTLVCGALALVIAISALLGGKVRKAHGLFSAFAAAVGLWYLSQSFFGVFRAPIWERLRLVPAILVPVLAANLFEAMVPDEEPARRRSRVGKLSLLVALPLAVLGLSTAIEFTLVRIGIFLYAVAFVAAGLFELGQRGLHSRSRAIQRRVRFLVVTGALAGLVIVADFVWIIGYEPAYHPPPVGVVLSVVFLFMLAQAVRHQRLLDLYEMLGRLLVATALAFIIAFVFYVMVTVVGQFNTMWLNAIVVAIVVLVLFTPLRNWVETQIQRRVLRERGRLEAALSRARRRLAHTLEIEELGSVVMAALEQSRNVTIAALYLLLEDGLVFERLAAIGTRAPARIEVATAKALLAELEHGGVVLEQLVRDHREGRATPPEHTATESVLAAAEVLGELKDNAVVVGVKTDGGALVGLLVVADERIGDAFSPEEVALLEMLATQIGVVVENSKHYGKMKERDRLAVLGQLAAGLAHEIRNPLGAIKGAAQLLAEPDPAGAQLDDSAREFLGIILEEVERLDGVVGSVLDLARQNTDVFPPIDVNAVIRRTLQVMSADWDGAVSVDTDLDETLPRAAVAPEQLRQVIMNVVRNSLQAMAPGGRVSIRTRTRERTREPSDAAAECDADSWIVMSVTDDGTGIAPTAMKHIFLPFFTTKDGGTGLGLAICQRIVQSAGGRVDVRSRPGEGTTFDILLPAAMEALGTPAPGVGAEVAPGREAAAGEGAAPAEKADAEAPKVVGNAVS